RQRRDLDMEGRKIHVILARSTSMPQLGERSGVIRVKQYKQSLAIESDGKKGSKVFMYYFDNPGGQIPSWLINWAAKAGLELLTSSNPLASASQSAGITGMSHHTRPIRAEPSGKLRIREISSSFRQTQTFCNRLSGRKRKDIKIKT
ncbi:PCTP isoform 2, partial [Pan troglodytes]